jgi:hypothetical protein
MLSFSSYILSERLDFDFLQDARTTGNAVFDALLIYIKSHGGLPETRDTRKIRSYFKNDPNTHCVRVRDLPVTDDIKSRYGSSLISFVPYVVLNPKYNGMGLYFEGGYSHPTGPAFIRAITTRLFTILNSIFIGYVTPINDTSRFAYEMSNIRRTTFLHEWTHYMQYVMAKKNVEYADAKDDLDAYHNRSAEVEAFTQEILHDLDLTFNPTFGPKGVKTFKQCNWSSRSKFNSPNELLRAMLADAHARGIYDKFNAENKINVLRVVYDNYKKIIMNQTLKAIAPDKSRAREIAMRKMEIDHERRKRDAFLNAVFARKREALKARA